MKPTRDQNLSDFWASRETITPLPQPYPYRRILRHVAIALLLLVVCITWSAVVVPAVVWVWRAL